MAPLQVLALEEQDSRLMAAVHQSEGFASGARVCTALSLVGWAAPDIRGIAAHPRLSPRRPDAAHPSRSAFGVAAATATVRSHPRPHSSAPTMKRPQPKDSPRPMGWPQRVRWPQDMWCSCGSWVDRNSQARRNTWWAATRGIAATHAAAMAHGIPTGCGIGTTHGVATHGIAAKAVTPVWGRCK